MRKRPKDILCCAEAFLKRLNREHLQNEKAFGPDFIQSLERHSWMGNVRELQNCIERAYYLCDEREISAEYFSNISQEAEEQEPATDGRLMSVDNAMKNNIEVILKDCKGDVFEAASRLNMSRASLYRRIKKYDIQLNQIKKGLS